MKKYILFLTVLFSINSFSQNKKDTIKLIQQTASLYNLNFTDAEADSMIGNLVGFKRTYARMHQQLPPNDLLYPFAFQPVPVGTTINKKQQNVVWNIPKNVSLPTNRQDLAFYSIPQLASLLRSKKITSVDLTKFFLERLKTWGDTLESVITITENMALRQAKQADDELRKGIDKGLLHGIPYGLKDLFAVRGYKTTWGSTPYKDQFLEYDSYVYTQLTKAGAVLCAKLSLGALAYNNKWFGGETKNPWNLQQGSSGSSAGSAASVVAGLLPFTIGTETLGSIISPSTRCGATGLRPTFGSISRSGAMVLCWSLDKAGPICRSAEDDAIVYYYLKGTDGKDPGAVNPAFNYNPNRDVKKLRVAYAENYFRRLPKNAPEWKVLDEYRAMGVKLEPAIFPDSGVYISNLVGIVLNAESAAAFDELTRTDRDDLIERQDKDFWPNSFRAARLIPAVEYLNANRHRSTLSKKVQDFMQQYDVVIVPTYAGGQLAITNLTGNPAVCMPIGFSASGNPLSITLLGNLYDEASILEAAKAYQEKTDHHKKRPSIFNQGTLTTNTASGQNNDIDLLVYNAKVYTVDSRFSTASAIAIKNGKIVETGTTQNLTSKYKATNKVDAKGKFIYPGFIDAHAHFFNYGLSLQRADLSGTESWEQILQQLQSFVVEKNIKNGDWIIGRGWDQNDWKIKEFPTKEKLDQLFPNNPVLLTRVDGHAAVANQHALNIANVKAGDKLTGGDVEVENGKLTGILIDNAIGLVASKIPPPTTAHVIEGLKDAQEKLFAVGLTTVDDCGLSYQSVLLIDSLQKAGALKMRIYAMLSDAKPNYEFAFSRGKIKTDYLNVRSFKVYADGALGSRGAALLEPYSDRKDWYGFLLSSKNHFDSVANIIFKNDWQMCTHAIGDSGNREILNIYAKYLKGKNDKRWRIEHAQVVNQNDFKLFGRYNIIPSVQPTHATSDMYWAGQRLGSHREKGAYAFKQLLDENGWIPLGTDFPVEDISPFKTFHSAVWRQDEKNYPKNGYQKENALTRQETLKGMTIWAARSNFEENEKGSLEKGKFADFIILDTDIMIANPKDILKTSVLATYVNGEKVYGK